jgi:hypothetical protein
MPETITDVEDAAAARFHPQLMRPSDDEEEVRILGIGYYDEVEVYWPSTHSPDPTLPKPSCSRYIPPAHSRAMLLATPKASTS